MINTTTKTQIRDMVVAQIASKELSNAEAARQIGMSDAYWSMIRNGKWDTVSDAIWLKAAAWCGYTFNQWTLVPTPQLTTVTNLLNDAQENCRMLALSAATGLGKSTALEYYFQNNANVYMMLCTVTMSRKDFLSAIQEAMGIEVEGSIHTRIESIIEKLTSSSYPLLILDDAGKLNDRCLQLVQVIYDRTKDRAGIVLAGTETLRNYIHKMALRDKLGFRELKRRIAYWERLQPVTIHAVKNFCSRFNITDVDCINFCARTCKDYGTLRELLLNANRVAIKQQGPITLDILENVHVGDAHTKFDSAA